MTYRWDLAHLLHIPPDRIGWLTPDELTSATDWIDRYAKAMQGEG